MATVLYITTCWLLSGVLILALEHKVRQWPRYRSALIAYHIVPEALASTAAFALLVAEAMTVVLLVLLIPAGLLFCGVLLAVYAGAIGLNLLRGRREIDCGCGDEPTPLSLKLLLRNLVLVFFAFWQWVTVTGFEYSDLLSLGLVATAIGASIAGLMIYASINQLLANRGKHQRLWLSDRT